MGDKTALDVEAQLDSDLIVGSASNLYIVPYSYGLQNNSAYMEMVQTQ